MKLSSIVSCLLVLLLCGTCNGASDVASSKVSNTKTVDKLSYPKKVSSLKKRPPKSTLKKVADITEKFKDLPSDDLEFIKELDKQFKLHGGKVKIKVENVNTTETKNSKRTIEGELGYGYAHNGYEYNSPKYMFYPYSQQDISKDAPKYYLSGEEKTEVSVEPSYSYELKPQTYITHNQAQIDVPHPDAGQQQHQQQQQQPEDYSQQQHHVQQQYEEPVIILRIPGPAKYASHLQTLLQQYLEIRAAQYLRILEEAEQRKHQQSHHQLQQIDYGHSAAGAAGVVEQEEHYHQQAQIPEQHDYQQQVEYDHKIAVTPQSIQYPEIDNVYNSYKHRHASHPQQAQQPQPDEQAYYAPQHVAAEEEQHNVHQQLQYQQQQQEQEQPQFYYTHQQQYAQPEGPPANTYQHVFLVSMTPQLHDGYEESSHPQSGQQQPIYVQEHQPQAHAEHSPHILENNPRPSHTKVVFTHNSEHTSEDYQRYQLPSIKPNERRSATSVPDYHQDFQQYQHLHGQQESQESAQNYQQHASNIESAAHQETAAITQRPYNYHAHSVKTRARGRSAHKRRATSFKEDDHGLQKIREYVREKLGAETGSVVEFKTTQVIENK